MWWALQKGPHHQRQLAPGWPSARAWVIARSVLVQVAGRQKSSTTLQLARCILQAILSLQKDSTPRVYYPVADQSCGGPSGEDASHFWPTFFVCVRAHSCDAVLCHCARHPRVLMVCCPQHGFLNSMPHLQRRNSRRPTGLAREGLKLLLSVCAALSEVVISRRDHLADPERTLTYPSRSRPIVDTVAWSCVHSSAARKWDAMRLTHPQ